MRREISVPPTILPDTAAENEVVLLPRRGWSGRAPDPRIVHGDRTDARNPRWTSQRAVGSLPNQGSHGMTGVD
jgi:hypothetical protein